MNIPVFLRAAGFVGGLIGCCGAALADTPATRSAEPFARELERDIRGRLDASERGDAATWARHVDDACFCGGFTKAALVADIAARPKSVANGYGALQDVAAHRHGDVATAVYRTTEVSVVGGQRLEIDLRRTETYRRASAAEQTAGGPSWILIAGADTVLARDPTVARIDAKLLDSYVGRYEYGPGAIDVVTRDGDRLFVATEGQERIELLPEDDTTFFIRGEVGRTRFVRDPSGKVTAMEYRQNGQALVARRVL
jgi:hypothetical protein